MRVLIFKKPHLPILPDLVKPLNRFDNNMNISWAKSLNAHK